MRALPVTCRVMIALTAAWASAIYGVHLGLAVEPVEFSNWGSLVVLFAAISEYMLLQNELKMLYKSLEGQGAAEYGSSGIPDISPPASHKALSLVAHVTVVSGTLIWGFGGKWLALLVTP